MKPYGPFVEVEQVAPPWAHNPEAIYIPERGKAFGRVAIYALGDGVPIHGKIKDCSAKRALHEATRKKSGNTTVNFTIHYSDSGFWGSWKQHQAQIVDFPAAYSFPGNWNPAPMIMNDGRVRIVVHTNDPVTWTGEVIVEAKTWEGPYRPITKDITNCTRCAEDPFMYQDKRGHFHLLYHRMFDPINNSSKSAIPSPGWCGGILFSRRLELVTHSPRIQHDSSLCGWFNSRDEAPRAAKASIRH